jgi:small-conductance mechanosensitive channel
MLADFFANSTIGGWDAVLAIAVLVAGWITAGFARRATLTLMHKLPNITEGAASLTARLVRYALLLLTIGIVLTVLGAPLQPVLAAVIIITAVAALALRGIAANFGAGLVIQVRKLVQIGDEIEVLEFTGVVHELNGRSVSIHTADGRSVRVPNSAFVDNPFTNYTERGLYRSEIELRATTDRAHDEVGDLIVVLLENCDRIRSVPTPQALLSRADPGALAFSVRFWHDPHHRAETRSAAVRALAAGFAREHIPASIDWRVPPPPLTPPPAPPAQ